MGGQEIGGGFTLPGVVEGEIEQVDVGSRIGDAVVVLVFYPSNFGPQSGRSVTLLRAVEEFESESEAVGVGVSTESVYSHRQFATDADVNLALASDVDAEVAASYDILTTRECGQRVPELSLFVLDYRGVVVEEWRASDSTDLPDFEAIRSRIGAITPDRSARGCYRVGYARYVEGRRHLSSGFEHCEQRNWGLAQTEFDDACREFGEATDLFTKGQGLAVEPDISEHNGNGRITATKLWEAAEWLAGFATASGKGESEKRRENRREADRVLSDVRELDPLPEPGIGTDTRRERRVP